MTELQYTLNLSKVMATSLAEYNEFSQKDKTYPKIPKEYSIQKRMLNCDSRRKEIDIIDKILDLNIDFKLFIFNALKSSFDQLDEKIAKVFLINKYFQENGMYHNYRIHLKEGKHSYRFKFFVGRYLNYKNQDLFLPINILVNYQFYNSMLWIYELATKTLGIQEVWELIDSYIN
tara:strand:+ start:88 stop:612 length:525 start_codon:yes stop_codon:yes gene_type:complete